MSAAVCATDPRLRWFVLTKMAAQGKYWYNIIQDLILSAVDSSHMNLTAISIKP